MASASDPYLLKSDTGKLADHPTGGLKGFHSAPKPELRTARMEEQAVCDYITEKNPAFPATTLCLLQWNVHRMQRRPEPAARPQHSKNLSQTLTQSGVGQRNPGEDDIETLWGKWKRLCAGS